jgi:hypothetical protein
MCRPWGDLCVVPCVVPKQAPRVVAGTDQRNAEPLDIGHVSALREEIVWARGVSASLGRAVGRRQWTRGIMFVWPL